MKIYWIFTLFLMMAAVGMSLDRRKVVMKWTHSSKQFWFGVIVATFGLPPLFALILAETLPVEPGVRVGLLLMSVAPGAPMLTRMIAQKGGGVFDTELAASYQILVGLLVPFLTPALIFTLGAFYHRDVWVNPVTIAVQVATMQFLPLTVGMLVREKFPDFARRAEPWLNRAGNLMVIAYLLLVMFSIRKVLLAIGPSYAGSAALLVLGCLTIGHFLGGPTVALTNANRHVGLALLIAGMNFKPRMTVLVPFFAGYAVLAPIAMTLYALWQRKRRAAVEEALLPR